MPMLTSDTLQSDDPLRRELRRFHRLNETEVLDYLIPLAEIGNAARSRSWERARKLVLEIRRRQAGKGGVDALLNEFALSTEEGVVLMCLAEALLRVPDSLTVDRLIRDKLAAGNWSSHLGNSESLFVNASAWGLLLTGKVVTYNEEHSERQFGLLRKTMGRVGEPVIRAAVRYAMQIMGTQFVIGTSVKSAVHRAREEEAKGYRYSYDMLGEGARTMAQADRHLDSYRNAIEVIGGVAAGRGPIDSPGISIKLSAIHPRYAFAQRERVMTELVPRLKSLALAAKARDIGFTVDAEEADRLDLSLDVIEAVFADPALVGWDGFGVAVQAYLRPGSHVIDWLYALCERLDRRMMVRLVKGAYWDSEIKIGQVEGHADYPVFTRKASSDVSYQACARRLLACRDRLYPQFATHNAYSVATILEMDRDRSGYEFQRLHGMGEALFDQVVQGEAVPCRIYAPVGVHADLLAYLVRRLLENGSNSSFVNNIVDEEIPVEALLEDPLEQARSWTSAPNPGIPLPRDLFGEQRLNSLGADLSDPPALDALRGAMDNWLTALPLDRRTGTGVALRIVNPADHAEHVGTVTLADEAAVELALGRAAAALPLWAASRPADRRDLLARLADKLEQHQAELIALCCKEAGKTAVDGVAEVREAVDFCRYYGARTVAEDFGAQQLRPRGVVLCISPWNFPLAIFLGQVTAALAAGNTVIAKPAEQTSLIAIRAIELLREVGLPEGVVELVIVEGPRAGELLVPDPRIKAVMFTGSTEAGHWINQRLAGRPDAPIPLVAETGGQNCMVVDSTALPEQVVDDVIASGFQSAGQRCSALRVLFLQEDIADRVIAMIIGAMRELRVGDPALLATDVGPVINHPALARLQQHTAYLEHSGRLLHACDAPAQGSGTYFPPHLYEISNLSLLEREVFGPVVHVIRYRADELDKLVEQINSLGYGLTFGVHSRIEQFTSLLAQRIQAGNIYINRNMIGAVVGAQPFGGRGLSGTGPKAGGPEYLARLVSTGEEAENAANQQALPVCAEEQADPLAGALAALPAWSATSLNDRLSVLRRFIALYAERQSDDNPVILETTLAAARAQLSYAAQVLAEPRELPGPTGESNHLLLESRGALLTLLDDSAFAGEYLMAILSALAGGNAVTAFAADALLQDWQAIQACLEDAGLPSGACSLRPLAQAAGCIASPALAGAMVHARSVHLHAVAQALAARPGAILPLISCVSPRTLLRQTMLEKTVSIDTTAAGGNASLLTMTI